MAQPRDRTARSVQRIEIDGAVLRSAGIDHIGRWLRLRARLTEGTDRDGARANGERGTELDLRVAIGSDQPRALFPGARFVPLERVHRARSLRGIPDSAHRQPVTIHANRVAEQAALPTAWWIQTLVIAPHAVLLTDDIDDSGEGAGVVPRTAGSKRRTHRNATIEQS